MDGVACGGFSTVFFWESLSPLGTWNLLGTFFIISRIMFFSIMVLVV